MEENEVVSEHSFEIKSMQRSSGEGGGGSHGTEVRNKIIISRPKRWDQHRK